MAPSFEEARAVPEEPRLRRLDKLSQVLDTAFRIPGTRFRIGLDGLVGLIPGVGDTLGALLSTYLIFEAARLGYPKSTLLRMVGNVAVEAVVGAVPVIGDIFDIVWKANVRNVALLRAHTAGTKRAGRSPRQLMSLFFIAVALALIGVVAISLFIFRLIYQLIAG